MSNWQQWGVRVRSRAVVFREELGQTMAEYALILAGVAVAVVATIALFGTAIKDTFTSIMGSF